MVAPVHDVALIQELPLIIATLKTLENFFMYRRPYRREYFDVALLGAKLYDVLVDKVSFSLSAHSSTVFNIYLAIQSTIYQKQDPVLFLDAVGSRPADGQAGAGLRLRLGPRDVLHGGQGHHGAVLPHEGVPRVEQVQQGTLQVRSHHQTLQRRRTLRPQRRYPSTSRSSSTSSPSVPTPIKIPSYDSTSLLS